MRSQTSFSDRIQLQKKLIRSSIRCLLLTTMTCCTVLMLVGCELRPVEVLYARAEKLPEETKGFMRLAQDSAKVQVVGQEKIGTTRGVAGYFLVHEADLARLVKNTEILNALRSANTDLVKAAESKLK